MWTTTITKANEDALPRKARKVITESQITKDAFEYSSDQLEEQFHVSDSTLGPASAEIYGIPKATISVFDVGYYFEQWFADYILVKAFCANSRVRRKRFKHLIKMTNILILIVAAAGIIYTILPDLLSN
jgi:hypothetical protein